MHVEPHDPAWMTHQQLEAQPMGPGSTWGDHQRAMGKKPCPGTMRLMEDDGAAHRLAECDACGFQITTKRSSLDPSLLGEERLARSRLPQLPEEDIKTPRTEDARDALRGFVQHWTDSDREKPPLLYGKPGTGKTHLLVLAARTIARTHHARVLYWTASELLGTLRASYAGGGACSEWEQALNVALLVLDDLGAERLTDWSREQLTNLLNHRQQLGLPILVATNVEMDDWADAFGPRAASRLAGMTTARRVVGPDWRQRRPSEGAARTSTDEST